MPGVCSLQPPIDDKYSGYVRALKILPATHTYSLLFKSSRYDIADTHIMHDPDGYKLFTNPHLSGIYFVQISTVVD